MEVAADVDGGVVIGFSYCMFSVLAGSLLVSGYSDSCTVWSVVHVPPACCTG